MLPSNGEAVTESVALEDVLNATVFNNNRHLL
jgi:hypothetical protein